MLLNVFFKSNSLALAKLSAESFAELYCFSYKPNVDEEERRQEWDFLEVKADYSRMGLPNSMWKLSSINQHYEVRETTDVFFLLVLKRTSMLLPHKRIFFFVFCFLSPKVSETYPTDLFVPDSATPPVIKGSSRFRSRGRFPTLSYYCRENHVRRLWSLLSKDWT